MEEQEIINIVENENDEKILSHINTLLDKSKNLAKESDYLGIVLILIFLLYYIVQYSKLGSIQIGPILIEDLNTINIFSPLAFSFVIFRYVLISSHKADIHKTIELYSQYFYKINKKKLKNNHVQLDDFTRSILPFSIYSELNNIAFKGKSKLGCFGAIIIFPLSLILIFLPFYIEFLMIKNSLLLWNEINYIGKTSIIFSIWLVIISIYFPIHKMIITIKSVN